MKKWFLFGCILLSITAFSQVGINTTNPKAQLEIQSSDQANPTVTDGILIPKVDVFPAVNPTLDQDGMMVYLTTLSGTNEPGFYYWDNTNSVWKGIGSNKGWSLTGNAGTDATVNYIGTTDDTDVIFKRFNTKSGLISSTNTSFGFNTLPNNGAGNTALGVRSLSTNVSGNYNCAVGLASLYFNSTGENNVAFGVSSLYINSSGDDNQAIGYHSLLNNNIGSRNSALGSNALNNNSLGNDNIAIGYNALKFNTTSQNLAVGIEAMMNNINGGENTAIGYRSLFNNNGDQNTSLGYQTLYQNSSGGKNSALGYEALYYNNSGFFNNAIGYRSLYYNTIGNYNIAMGQTSLYYNTQGSNNTAIGNSALFNNTTASYNVGIGDDSLYSNTTGNFNSALGYNAMYYNTIGYYNTSIGFYALKGNTTGFENTAIGTGAMELSVGSNKNVAIGRSALFSNKNKSANIAIGYEAMRNAGINDLVTIETNNIGIGQRAMFKVEGGRNNVAIGPNALDDNVIGNFNVAIGSNSMNSCESDGNVGVGIWSGYDLITGIYNTCMGSYAGRFLPSNVNNVSCLGQSAGFATTSSNNINIGNMSVTNIAGQVNWGTYSDQRIKTNISENVPGLSFIKKLKPVTYNLDIRKQFEIANPGKEDTSGEWEEKYEIETIKMTGFLAQEVEAAAKSINYDFSGVVAPKDGQGLYSLRYAEFVVPLVKSVQEQQEIIEKQTTTINDQNTEIELLKKLAKNLEERLKLVEEQNKL
jgi:trimeric autotransporter adhesin